MTWVFMYPVLPIYVAIIPAFSYVHLNFAIRILTANKQVITTTTLFALTHSKLMFMLHSLIIPEIDVICKTFI